MSKSHRKIKHKTKYAILNSFTEESLSFLNIYSFRYAYFYNKSSPQFACNTLCTWKVEWDLQLKTCTHFNILSKIIFKYFRKFLAAKRQKVCHLLENYQNYCSFYLMLWYCVINLQKKKKELNIFAEASQCWPIMHYRNKCKKRHFVLHTFRYKGKFSGWK